MAYSEWTRQADEKIQKLEELDTEQAAYTATEKEMLDFVLTFSEMTHGATASFIDGTDAEKRKLTHKVFSELVVIDGVLASYKAKENYAVLLNRPSVQSGAAGWNRTSMPL